MNNTDSKQEAEKPCAKVLPPEPPTPEAGAIFREGLERIWRLSDLKMKRQSSDVATLQGVAHHYLLQGIAANDFYKYDPDAPRASVAAVEGDAEKIAQRVVEYLSGKYIAPDIALMEVVPIAEVIAAASSPAPAEPPPTSPRCPKCGYVMCEQFDSRPVNALADIVTPNGSYICYHCAPAEPLQPTGEQEKR